MGIKTRCSQSTLYTAVVNLLVFIYFAGYPCFESDPRISKLSILTAAMLFGVLLMNMLFTKRLVIPRLLALPMVFLAFAVISILMARDQDLAMLFGSIAFSAIGGAIALWTALYNGLSYRTLFIAALVGSAVVIISSILNPAEVSDGVARSGGTFSNPNVSAIYLTCCAFVISSPPPGTTRVATSKLLIAAVLVISALVFTGSRKAIFSVALYLFYVLAVLIVQSRNRLNAVLAALSVAALLAIVVMLIAPNTGIFRAVSEVGTIQRFSSLLQGRDESGAIRQAMISYGLQLWKQNPWIGYGFGQYAILSPFGVYAHCNYVELLCDSGLVGFSIYYLFHVVILAESIKKLRRPQQLAAGVIILVSLLIDVANVSVVSKASWMLFVLAAYLCASDKPPIVLVLGSNSNTSKRRGSVALSKDKVPLIVSGGASVIKSRFDRTSSG